MKKIDAERKRLQTLIIICTTIPFILFYILPSERPFESVWKSVKKTNFAFSDDKVRAEYCHDEGQCLYVIDRIEGTQIHRLMTREKRNYKSIIGRQILEVNPNVMNTSKWRIDHSQVVVKSLNAAQLVSVFQSGQIPLSKDIEGNVLVIGTGTGTVFMHFQHHFKKISITGLEISELAVKIAKEWFNFEPNSQNRFILLDAEEHVKQSIEENHLYDIILADVCEEEFVADGWMCPPESLISDEFISNLRKVMKPNGILSMNLLHIENFLEKHQELLDKFSKHFEFCEFFELIDKVNSILLCYSSKKPEKEHDPRKFLLAIGF